MMSIKAGLVGLPNVGKSTLFNALTKSTVPAENYPFCTIEPHMAITEVPDARIEKLVEIYKSQKIVGSTVSFVDIAGLVKGAASGEGLGNTFLSHIREVDLILHVLRCFEDPEITLSGESIDPIEDYDTITSELMLKDFESVEKRIEKIQHSLKAAKNKPQELKELQDELELLKTVEKQIDAGNINAIIETLKSTEIKTIPLLCAKNFLIIANVSESDLENGYDSNPHYQALVAKFGTDRVVPVSAKLEHELSQLDDSDAQEAMGMFGLTERGLDNIIKQTYHNLGLITFFTCGPKETHAWPIKKGISVRSAAGEIHSDLEKGFICADVFNCKDLFEFGSEANVKQHGKMRTEGQDYIVQDGDIIHVKFNV